jgi:hypothetical protein
MPRHRKGWVRPYQDVFKMVNMMGGDTHACWPWEGAVSPNPIWCHNGRRLQARKLVYALKWGVPYARTPPIIMLCGNDLCCNPRHMAPRYSDLAKLSAKPLDNTSGV